MKHHSTFPVIKSLVVLVIVGIGLVSLLLLSSTGINGELTSENIITGMAISGFVEDDNIIPQLGEIVIDPVRGIVNENNEFTIDVKAYPKSNGINTFYVNILYPREFVEPDLNSVKSLLTILRIDYKWIYTNYDQINDRLFIRLKPIDNLIDSKLLDLFSVKFTTRNVNKDQDIDLDIGYVNFKSSSYEYPTKINSKYTILNMIDNDNDGFSPPQDCDDDMSNDPNNCPTYFNDCYGLAGTTQVVKQEFKKCAICKNPNMYEICDGIDNNCNGIVDGNTKMYDLCESGACPDTSAGGTSTECEDKTILDMSLLIGKKIYLKNAGKNKYACVGDHSNNQFIKECNKEDMNTKWIIGPGSENRVKFGSKDDLDTSGNPYVICAKKNDVIPTKLYKCSESNSDHTANYLWEWIPMKGSNDIVFKLYYSDSSTKDDYMALEKKINDDYGYLSTSISGDSTYHTEWIIEELPAVTKETECENNIDDDGDGKTDWDDYDCKGILCGGSTSKEIVWSVFPSSTMPLFTGCCEPDQCAFCENNGICNSNSLTCVDYDNPFAVINKYMICDRNNNWLLCDASKEGHISDGGNYYCENVEGSYKWIPYYEKYIGKEIYLKNIDKNKYLCPQLSGNYMNNCNKDDPLSKWKLVKGNTDGTVMFESVNKKDNNGVGVYVSTNPDGILIYNLYDISSSIYENEWLIDMNDGYLIFKSNIPSTYKYSTSIYLSMYYTNTNSYRTSSLTSSYYKTKWQIEPVEETAKTTETLIYLSPLIGKKVYLKNAGFSDNLGDYICLIESIDAFKIIKRCDKGPDAELTLVETPNGNIIMESVKYKEDSEQQKGLAICNYPGSSIKFCGQETSTSNYWKWQWLPDIQNKNLVFKLPENGKYLSWYVNEKKMYESTTKEGTDNIKTEWQFELVPEQVVSETFKIPNELTPGCGIDADNDGNMCDPFETYLTCPEDCPMADVCGASPTIKLNGVNIDCNIDTDGDGLPDGYEDYLEMNKPDAFKNPVDIKWFDKSSADTDNDGVPDGKDYCPGTDTKDKTLTLATGHININGCYLGDSGTLRTDSKSKLGPDGCVDPKQDGSYILQYYLKQQNSGMSPNSCTNVYGETLTVK
ncbi:MAG: MopE-related protein [Candidatus Woesearchaeota archaeon]